MIPNQVSPSAKARSKHLQFIEWVKENYSGMDYVWVMDRYFQTGEYPEEFEEDYKRSQNEI